MSFALATLTSESDVDRSGAVSSISVLSTGVAANIELAKQLQPCLPGMAKINEYCIDRYEATLVEKTPDGRELPHDAALRPKPDVRYEARSLAGVRPQGYVCRDDAANACRNAGKRLCSIWEWYVACGGSRHSVYPYGEQFMKGKCNTGKLHLLGKFFGHDPRLWSYGDFNDPRLNREPGFLELTGAYRECTNDYGAHDMVGNLHEWVSDRVDYSLETKLPLVDGVRRSIRKNIGHGVFMGGFYSTDNQQGPGCGFITPGHERRYHDYSVGFRCCADLRPDVSR